MWSGWVHGWRNGFSVRSDEVMSGWVNGTEELADRSVGGSAGRRFRLAAG